MKLLEERIRKDDMASVLDKMVHADVIVFGTPVYFYAMSGHFFFADRYYGYDDAFYAAVRLLDVISNGYEENLGQRAEKYMQIPIINIACWHANTALRRSPI